jgi:hypothetical protein
MTRNHDETTDKGLSFFQFDLTRKVSCLPGYLFGGGRDQSEPWKSLNLGGLSGDSRENIIENRKRSLIASIYGRINF